MGAAGSSARYRSRYSEADAIAACDGQPYDFDEAKWSRVPKGSDGRADLVDILSSLCEGRSVHFTRKLWAAPQKPALAPIAARPIEVVPYVKLVSTRPVLEIQLLENKNEAGKRCHSMFLTYKTKRSNASGAKTAADERAITALEVSLNTTSVSTVPHLRTPKSTSADLPTGALCSRSI